MLNAEGDQWILHEPIRTGYKLENNYEALLLTRIRLTHLSLRALTGKATKEAFVRVANSSSAATRSLGVTC